MFPASPQTRSRWPEGTPSGPSDFINLPGKTNRLVVWLNESPADASTEKRQTFLRSRRASCAVVMGTQPVTSSTQRDTARGHGQHDRAARRSGAVGVYDERGRISSFGKPSHVWERPRPADGSPATWASGRDGSDDAATSVIRDVDTGSSDLVLSPLDRAAVIGVRLGVLAFSLGFWFVVIDRIS